ncbi:YecA family protein [Pradoshia sp.]
MTTATQVDEYQLETLLDALKMDALKNIRRNLNLKNMSSLRKKELVQALVEHIPASVPERTKMMDLQQYTSIVALMTKSGVMPLDQIALEDVFYLSSIGYIHPSKQDDQPIVVMPTQVMEQFFNLNPKDIMTVVNRNQKVSNILFGIVRYYGFADLEMVKKMVEAYLEEEVEAEWLNNYVSYLADYYGMFYTKDGYLIHQTIRELDSFKQVLNTKEDLKYYPLPAESMLNLNRYESFEKTAEIVEFSQFLQDTYSLEAAQANELIEQFLYKVQFGHGLQEVVKWFGEKVELQNEKDVNAIVEQIAKVVNHTRLWVLKGFTPLELAPQLEGSEKQGPVKNNKIPRNAPCACGSGKKYKRCCMK